MKTEADLHSGRMVVVCRPASLPRIAAIRFEGNTRSPIGALQAAMAKVADGPGVHGARFPPHAGAQRQAAL